MEDLKITVENKGEEGKRKLMVYNSINQEYSFIPDKGEQGTVTKKEYNIPPMPPTEEKNYLIIAPAPGPSDEVGPCTIDIPVNSMSQINLTQSRIENMTINPSSEKASLTIPLSPPTWQLKITRTSPVLTSREPVGTGQGGHG